MNKTGSYFSKSSQTRKEVRFINKYIKHLDYFGKM